MFCVDYFFFFLKQKTAYEMRISDWSSDVCSSDLADPGQHEDLGRAHDAGGQDHRARRPRDLPFATATPCDAGRAAGLDHDSLDERVGLDRQVGTRQDRKSVV